MTHSSTLQARARQKLTALRRKGGDERFARVMGRFVSDGLLVTNRPIVPHAKAIRVEEVLWAGAVEPRLLELLPALIVKRPSMFESVVDLPEDLDRTVRSLRRDEQPEAFRGVSGADVHRWLRSVGRQGKAPSRLKSFRFTPEDQRILRALVEKLEVSETDVIRRALRQLA